MGLDVFSLDVLVEEHAVEPIEISQPEWGQISSLLNHRHQRAGLPRPKQVRQKRNPILQSHSCGADYWRQDLPVEHPCRIERGIPAKVRGTFMCDAKRGVQDGNARLRV